MQYCILIFIIWSTVTGSLESNTDEISTKKYNESLLGTQRCLHEEIVQTYLNQQHIRPYIDRATRNQSVSYSHIESEKVPPVDQKTSEDSFLSDRISPKQTFHTALDSSVEENHNKSEYAIFRNSLSVQESNNNYGRRVHTPAFKDRANQDLKYYNITNVSAHKTLRELNFQPKTYSTSFLDQSTNLNNNVNKLKKKLIFDEDFNITIITDQERNNVTVGKDFKDSKGNTNDNSTLARNKNVSENFEQAYQTNGLNEFNYNESAASKKHSKSFPESDTVPAASLSLGKFSGPIVVPDIYQIKEVNTATNYTGNNNMHSTLKPIGHVIKSATSNKTPYKIPKSQNFDHVITSELILNPLQVGVTLVNAKESRRIHNDSNKLDGLSKNFISHNLTDLPNTIVNALVFAHNQSEKTTSKYDFLPKREHISKSLARDTSDQTVEIQKSVELYHNAPVQEIHYPFEYLPQVPNIQTILDTQKTNDKTDTENVRRNPHLFKTNNIPQESVTRIYEQHIPEEKNRATYNILENEIKKSPSPVQPLTKLYLSSIEQPDSYSSDSTAEQSNLNVPILLFQDQSQASFYSQNNLKRGLNGITMAVDTIPKQQEIDIFESDKDSKEFQNLPLEKIIKANPFSFVETKYPMPTTQSHPAERIVERTIHISHPIEVEKIIEKHVPFPLEKIIEKKVAVPQPYAVHIQIPVDRVVEKQTHIPIHIEKVIEKKVPYAIHRFIVQPYPIHIKLPQSYSIEQSSPVEKISEKGYNRESYTTEINTRLYPIEIQKYAAKPVLIDKSYDINYDVNYKQILKPPEQNLNYITELTSIPSYGKLVINDQQSHTNSSSFYDMPNKAIVDVKETKISYNNRKPYSNYLSTPGPTLNLGFHKEFNPQINFASQKRQARVLEKNTLFKNKYLDVTRLRQMHNSLGIQSKSPQFSGLDTQSPITIATLRRTRQPDSYFTAGSGNFRQSKMEYGFKPPMIPSVQYDEKTASKVNA